MDSETLRVLWFEYDKETNYRTGTKLYDTNLNPDIINALYRAKIEYVAQLERYSDKTLLSIKGIGKKRLNDIKVFLAEFQKDK